MKCYEVQFVDFGEVMSEIFESEIEAIKWSLENFPGCEPVVLEIER